MSGRLVLAVDCSTTAAKAVVVDGRGAVLASGSAALDLSRPGPGRHEQDAEQWWSSTRTAIRQAVHALHDPAAAASIAALAITHQRESFVCLSADGRPLRPAILWLDSRASREIAELGTPAVHAISGKQPDVTPALYKIAWLSRHEPEVVRATAVVADVHAYLAHRLAGRWATSVASGDSLGLLDLRAGTWSADLAALAGLTPSQLPELVPAGDTVGPLLPGVAEDLLLPQGVRLVAGLGDGQAAGLGADVTTAGVAYVNLGTSLVCGVASPEYLVGDAFRTLAGAPSGSYVLETVLNAASYLATWFRREFPGDVPAGAPDPALDAAAARIPPGSDGLLTVPYWNCAQTPYWDADARGVMVGWHGGHTRAHAYRSLLEGVAFELRLHLEGLEHATGQRISTLRAMGGGTRSPLWRQIVADVTQRPVEVCEGDELSARGAAVLAWAAVDGDPASVSQRVAPTAAAMRRVGTTVTADPSNANLYDRLFAVQTRIYPALRGVLADLAHISPGNG